MRACHVVHPGQAFLPPCAARLLIPIENQNALAPGDGLGERQGQGEVPHEAPDGDVLRVAELEQQQIIGCLEGQTRIGGPDPRLAGVPDFPVQQIADQGFDRPVSSSAIYSRST